MKKVLFSAVILLVLGLSVRPSFSQTDVEEYQGVDFIQHYVLSGEMNNDFGALTRYFQKNRFRIINDFSDKKTDSSPEYNELMDILDRVLTLQNIQIEQLELLPNSYERLALFINLYNALTIKLIFSEKWESLHQSVDKYYKKQEKRFQDFFNWDRFYTLSRFSFKHIGLLSLDDIFYGIILNDEDYMKELEGYAKDEAENISKIHNLLIKDIPDGKIDFRITFLLSNFCLIGNSLQNLPLAREITGSDLQKGKLVTSMTTQYLFKSDSGLDITYQKNYWLAGAKYKYGKIVLPYILKRFEQYILKDYDSIADFLVFYLPKDFDVEKAKFLRWVKDDAEPDFDLNFEYDMNKKRLYRNLGSID